MSPCRARRVRIFYLRLRSGQSVNGHFKTLSDVQFVGKQSDIAELNVVAEDVADDGGIVLDDGEAAAIWQVADRRCATHPHTARLRLGNLVADPLGSNLPLELCARQQHI